MAGRVKVGLAARKKNGERRKKDLVGSLKWRGWRKKEEGAQTPVPRDQILESFEYLMIL